MIESIRHPTPEEMEIYLRRAHAERAKALQGLFRWIASHLGHRHADHPASARYA
jgi:hypothetical protein